VYRIENQQAFFQVHATTQTEVMMLQEEIIFDKYYRCYCIGGKYVRVMPYEPRNEPHLRYQAAFDTPPSLLKLIESYVITLNQGLGYDLNTVEFAVREGIPYAIDFCNPAPDADVHSVGQENFDWVVQTMAKYAIERAQSQVDGKDNLTWGTFIKEASRSSEKKK
jgi:hypothetical protein